MGRDLRYVPGSYYSTDDRTGFPQRVERVRTEWTGLRVDESVWEARQPQDLVKGVRDQQSVPNPRPLAPNQFIGPIFGQLADAATPGQTVIVLQSTYGFSNGISISVMQDNGVNFTTTISGAPTTTDITLAAPLPYSAASGNIVTANVMNVPAQQEP